MRWTILNEVGQLIDVTAEMEQDRLDAQRYRKLKAYRDQCRDSEWAELWQSINLNSTVDALPVPARDGAG